MDSNLIKACLNLCTDKTHEQIIELLADSNVGNRVSRRTLVRNLHMSDRKMRDTINEMRSNGIPIASNMNGSGYYFPSTMFEYLDFSKGYKSRAATIFRVERAMKETAFNVFCGQLEIGGDG